MLAHSSKWLLLLDLGQPEAWSTELILWGHSYLNHLLPLEWISSRDAGPSTTLTVDCQHPDQ